jgi:hypothetical protein
MMAWWVWIIGAVAGCIGSLLLINETSPSNHQADVVQRSVTNALLVATAVLLWFVARQLDVP